MIVEGGGKYNVRLIPQTCNREDAIREIVGALDHLNAISDEIFTTIRTRLSSHRRKVEVLSSRVAVAAEQVSSLKGSQKAIRIISPAKYPCDEKEGASGGGGVFGPMLFPTVVAKNVPDPLVLGHDIEEDEEARCQRPFRFDTPIKHPNDLLSVFHVKEPKLGDLTQLDNMADVGLGRPPPTLRNMDSFFLFNTVDNPYINYKMTERSLQDRNFGTLKPTRKGEEVHAETCPIVSPDNEKGAEQKTDVDDFYYSPSALEIPNIDVPESLPDLPGIAESFDLLSDDLAAFPSFLPSKPSAVPTNPPKTSHNATPSSLSFLPEKEDDMIAVHTSTPANDVPPSLPKFDNTKVSNVETTRSPVVPPPPPPPPPPPILVTEGHSRSDNNTTTASSSSGGSDLRSSLMAAIREAGGSDKARLKSAKDRKYEAKKKKQDEKEKTITNDLQEGGDLMADLKNKLAMRRRGISGIQDGPKRAPGGVGEIMLSLAAAIPTIDNSLESSSGPQGGSDDDDWD